MTKVEVKTLVAGQKVLVAHAGKVYTGVYVRAWGPSKPTQHLVCVKYDNDEAPRNHMVSFAAIKFAPKAEAPKAKTQTPKVKAKTVEPKAEPKTETPVKAAKSSITEGLTGAQIIELAKALETLDRLGFDVKM